MIMPANRVCLPSNKALCFSPAETPKAEEPMKNTLNPVLLEDSHITYYPTLSCHNTIQFFASTLAAIAQGPLTALPSPIVVHVQQASPTFPPVWLAHDTSVQLEGQ